MRVRQGVRLRWASGAGIRAGCGRRGGGRAAHLATQLPVWKGRAKEVPHGGPRRPMLAGIRRVKGRSKLQGRISEGTDCLLGCMKGESEAAAGARTQAEQDRKLRRLPARYATLTDARPPAQPNQPNVGLRHQPTQRQARGARRGPARTQKQGRTRTFSLARARKDSDEAATRNGDVDERSHRRGAPPPCGTKRRT